MKNRIDCDKIKKQFMKGSKEKMEIIYATTNKAKKDQVQEFLEYNNYNIKLITLSDIGFDEEIEENRRYIRGKFFY